MISTLNLYLVRRFAVWLMIVTLGFGTIAMLGDFLEMLRLANRLNLGAGTAFGFTLHRLPLLLMDFLPFVFLLEERRVGKECRARWRLYHQKKKSSVYVSVTALELRKSERLDSV